MKFIISLLLVCTVCYAQADLSPEQVEKLKQHHTECAVESGVSPDLLTKARQGDFVEDEKLKNHLFCVSKKIGFQNQEGKLQVDVLQAKVSPVLGDADAANKIIKECAVDQANGPQTAFAAVKCFYTKSPNHTSIL